MLLMKRPFCQECSIVFMTRKPSFKIACEPPVLLPFRLIFWKSGLRDIFLHKIFNNSDFVCSCVFKHTRSRFTWLGDAENVLLGSRSGVDALPFSYDDWYCIDIASDACCSPSADVQESPKVSSFESLPNFRGIQIQSVFCHEFVVATANANSSRKL